MKTDKVLTPNKSICIDQTPKKSNTPASELVKSDRVHQYTKGKIDSDQSRSESFLVHLYSVIGKVMKFLSSRVE